MIVVNGAMRASGRPRQTWKEATKKDMRVANLSEELGFTTESKNKI